MTRVAAVLVTATGDLALVNELAAQPGIELRVLFSYRDRSGRGEHGPIRFPFRYLQETLSLRSDVQRGNRWVWNSDLASALRSCDPDVVFIGGYGNVAGLRAIVFALLRGTPWILFSDTQARDQPTKRSAKDYLVRYLVAHASGFVVFGPEGAAHVRSLGGTAPIVVLGSNRDLRSVATRADVVRSPGGRGRAVRFLCVNRLVELKGVDLVLEAFSAVARRYPEAELAIAGGGPLADKLRRARSSGLKIDLLGEVPFSRIPEVLAEADVFVLASREEAWGMVVPEAMAAGLPVIGSDAAGSVRFFINEETGWIVAAGAVDALAEAMETAMTADLREMGRRAQSIALGFDARESALQVASLIRDAARERLRRPVRFRGGGDRV